MSPPRKWQGYEVPATATLEELRTAASTGGAARWGAIVALGTRNDVDSLSILGKLASSPDAHVRRAAIEAFSTHSLGTRAARIVSEALSDRAGHVVRTACFVVGKLVLDAGRDRLVELLSDADSDTRIAALNALSRLWMPEYEKVVFGLYRADPSPKVRKAAAWALKGRVGAEQWKVVFKRWAQDSIPRHRVWACELVATFGELDDHALVEPLLGDSDGHVRQAATRATKRLSQRGEGPDEGHAGLFVSDNCSQ